jgi:peptidoglycan/LPS O-acetylase OafA/YrhL
MPEHDALLTEPRSHRIIAIDILRGVAIMWVLLYHVWIDVKLGFPPPADYYNRLGDRIASAELASLGTALIDAACRIGFHGVPWFMMLSGLALYISTAGQHVTPPWWRDALTFYASRIRRVIVPYWASFALFFLAVCGIALYRAHADGGGFAYQYHNGVTVSGYHVIDIGWIDASASLLVFPRLLRDEWFGVAPNSLWFVVVVVQYYLMFPFLRPLLDRIGPWAFLALALVCCLVARLWLIDEIGGLSSPRGIRLDAGIALFRWYDFAIGMTVGYLYVHRRQLLEEYTASPWDIAGVVFLGFLLHTGGTLIDDRRGELNAIASIMVVTGLTLVSLPLLTKRPAKFERLYPVRALAWIGPLSFAVLIANDLVRLLASLLRVEGISDPWWWIFLVAVYMPLTMVVARPLGIALGLVPGRRVARAAVSEAVAPAPG